MIDGMSHRCNDEKRVFDEHASQAGLWRFPVATAGKVQPVASLDEWAQRLELEIILPSAALLARRHVDANMGFASRCM